MWRHDSSMVSGTRPQLVDDVNDVDDQDEDARDPTHVQARGICLLGWVERVVKRRLHRLASYLRGPGLEALTGMRKTKTETNSRHARSCASAVLYVGSQLRTLPATRADPRMRSMLTRIDPRIEARTMSTWLFRSATLSVLGTPHVHSHHRSPELDLHAREALAEFWIRCSVEPLTRG